MSENVEIANVEVAKLLSDLGVDGDSYIAYAHQHKALFIIKKLTGQIKRRELENLLRVALNLQLRYVREYIRGFIAWGIVTVDDDETVRFVGKLKPLYEKALRGYKTARPKQGRPFPEYGPPPEKKS